MAQWANYLACFCAGTGSIPDLAQWVKDLTLLQQWRGSQLWFRFSPWPGNFHMLWKLKKNGIIMMKWQFGKGGRNGVARLVR